MMKRYGFDFFQILNAVVLRSNGATLKGSSKLD